MAVCEECWQEAVRRGFYDARSAVEIYTEVLEEAEMRFGIDRAPWHQCAEKSEDRAGSEV